MKTHLILLSLKTRTFLNVEKSFCQPENWRQVVSQWRLLFRTQLLSRGPGSKVCCRLKGIQEVAFRIVFCPVIGHGELET